VDNYVLPVDNLVVRQIRGQKADFRLKRGGRLFFADSHEKTKEARKSEKFRIALDKCKNMNILISELGARARQKTRAQ
jgi:hypothetical protein